MSIDVLARELAPRIKDNEILVRFRGRIEELERSENLEFKTLEECFELQGEVAQGEDPSLHHYHVRVRVKKRRKGEYELESVDVTDLTLRESQMRYSKRARGNIKSLIYGVLKNKENKSKDNKDKDNAYSLERNVGLLNNPQNFNRDKYFSMRDTRGDTFGFEIYQKDKNKPKLAFTIEGISDAVISIVKTMYEVSRSSDYEKRPANTGSARAPKIIA